MSVGGISSSWRRHGSCLRKLTETAVFIPAVAKQHDEFFCAIALRAFMSTRASFWLDERTRKLVVCFNEDFTKLELLPSPMSPLYVSVNVLQLTLSIECLWVGVRVGLWVGVESGLGTPIVCTSGRHVRSSLGTVEVNMSRIQRHTLCHVSEENWEPLETTRFSRQLVPDLASCSLSGKENVNMNKRLRVLAQSAFQITQNSYNIFAYVSSSNQ